jgi:hypothetical protein
MLANRADTYNLGDVIGGHLDAFKASYVENAATSNPALARLAGRSQKDLSTVLQLAENGARDGVDFEGSWSPEELNEFVGVMKKAAAHPRRGVAGERGIHRLRGAG